MDKMKRNERIGMIAHILTGSPNKIFTRSHFCQMFGAAKSTVSEDIDIIRTCFARFGAGEIETVAGASGGVRYLPFPVWAGALLLRICAGRSPSPSACCRRLSVHQRHSVLSPANRRHGSAAGKPVL
jgi:hypothetical protein